MPQTPRETPRRQDRRPLREAAAVLAATLALAPLLIAAPALALGEDGPFDLPLTRSEVSISPSSVSRIDITALLADSAEPELDLDTAQLAIPADLPEEERARMALSEDRTTLVVQDEGTWSIVDGQIVYVPDGAFDREITPVAITVAAPGGVRSRPSELTVTTPETVMHRVSASAGEVVTIHLQDQDPDLVEGRAGLQLDDLPRSSTVTEDGRRVVIPEQGTWELSEDRLTLTFTPLRPRLDSGQPSPVHYTAVDASGEATSTGVVAVVEPVIPNMKRSARFGDSIVFTLAEGQQNIDPATLTLAPVTDDGVATLSADGTVAEIPGQGRWILDRGESTVTFTPEDEDVIAAAPMGVRGGDGAGSTSSRALLDTSYPRIADLSQTGVHGSDVVFDPRSASRDIRADSLVLDAADLPEGATLSEDAQQLDVPGQGTWSIDREAMKIVFSPASADPGLVVSPVRVRAAGLYADNGTTATLTATFTGAVPTMRDDEVRTAPGVAITADVLANDTPAGVGQPLQPGTLRLRSMDAANLEELEDWTGTRLVIPDQGEYRIGSDGLLVFEPAPGFVGRAAEIEYLVTDSTGVPALATIAAEVDPDAASSAKVPQDTVGINTLLAGLMPDAPGTAVVFGSVVALTLFAGGTMLWIGSRMERDRRAWRD
ncbi:Ig-like domain-containing protein [Brachybacterium hainanense]|uniref:Ig-like domain-containing protein n=1 Tax=Brachybacterium hainanense TaxID=1541174 RepID=A0ABV6RF43_9MICO